MSEVGTSVDFWFVASSQYPPNDLVSIVIFIWIFHYFRQIPKETAV